MENQWLAWAKRLQAIASTGLHYNRDVFDRERYEETARIAQSMLAALGDVPVEHIRALISPGAHGYATPKVDVRGALIEDGRILLVREKSDGLWTLPGDFADVGTSPGENVCKEMLEEAGIRVSVDRLYSVRHKCRHDYDADIQDFYKMFFLCRRADRTPPRPGPETVEAAFFLPSVLPPLSTGRVIASDIEMAFAFHDDPSLTAYFD